MNLIGVSVIFRDELQILWAMGKCSGILRNSCRVQFVTLGLGVTPVLGPGTVSGDCCTIIKRETGYKTMRKQVKSNTNTKS